MFELTESFIKSQIADTPIIYYRGRCFHQHGSFALSEANPETGGADPAPEKMEAVLNSDMAFIGGLLEVATGKKISPTDDDERMVKIDKTTGEVTLKFKLPGF